MSKPYTLYGWHLSYFTGKVICYLRYKNIPYVMHDVDMFTLMVRIKNKCGAAVMPVLVTPEGEWINDSSLIIDHLEARFPKPSVFPDDPVQRFAAYLLEAWGDEWWVPIAMHTRWNYPENYALFEREAGDALLPKLPAFMQRKAVAKVATLLRGMLPSVGVRAEQNSLLDAWTNDMLDKLNAHFANNAFLFGDAPSIGDFGLVGTMYGHLGRDPWPARELIAPRSHLRGWIDRMANPPLNADAHSVSLTMPDTLAPIFHSIFAEFTAMISGINEQAKALLKTYPKDHALPRALDDVEVPINGNVFRRKALPYSLWMAQRALDVFHAMTDDEQKKVRNWFAPLGGEAFFALDIPCLKVSGVRVTPVGADKANA